MNISLGKLLFLKCTGKKVQRLQPSNSSFIAGSCIFISLRCTLSKEENLDQNFLNLIFHGCMLLSQSKPRGESSRSGVQTDPSAWRQSRTVDPVSWLRSNQTDLFFFFFINLLPVDRYHSTPAWNQPACFQQLGYGNCSHSSQSVAVCVCSLPATVSLMPTLAEKIN